MTHLSADMIFFYIGLVTNLCFAALFVYHFTKQNSNKSLMILAGVLCLNMVFNHVINGYKGTLEQSSLTYYNLVVNWYLIHLISNGAALICVFALHRAFKVQFHYVVRYVYRCIMLSMAMNLAMHMDLMVLGNRDTDWLYSMYTYGENLLLCFVFVSVVVARKWSEVFRWLQSAHVH